MANNPLQTRRASYQHINHNLRLTREPFVCPAYRRTLHDLSAEATSAAAATTQAAYFLRLNKIRQLIKSLG